MQPGLVGKGSGANIGLPGEGPDIGQFTDLEDYKANIDEMIDGIKALPRVDGFDEVLVPGEPEYRTYLDRSKNGVPLPALTVQKLRDVAERLGVKVPSEIEAA